MVTPDDSPAPVSVPEGRPVSVANPAAKPGRGPWVTAAAVILVVYGGLGILYAPLLTGDTLWRILGVGISTLTIVGALNIVTGVGLLRLDGWARFAAVLLSAFGLLAIQAPALVAAAASSAWGAIDWLGLVGMVVVLFAVLRRWPAEPERAG